MSSGNIPNTDHANVVTSPSPGGRDHHEPSTNETLTPMNDANQPTLLGLPTHSPVNDVALQQHVSETDFGYRQGTSYNDLDEITSPHSTRSFTFYPADVAPLRWFGLLTDDANELLSGSYTTDANIALPNDLSRHTSIIEELQSPSAPSHFKYPNGCVPITQAPYRNPLSPEPMHLSAAYEPWQASTVLKEFEIPIFTHFVHHLSQWLDLSDPLRHFQILVPHLAVQNEGLMKAILALSARHISIKPAESGGIALDRTTAVRYYAETLQYHQRAMKYDSYKSSLELITTTLIVSTYEMLDGHDSGWERHLKGIFWVLRSQDINGQSGGLRQAVWWACRRQDVWAAFRQRRVCYSFYKPTLPYEYLTPFDIAARAVYLLSQAVNYSSTSSIEMGEQDLQMRIQNGQYLSKMLDDWQSAVTIHFRPLPLEKATDVEITFEPIWINPPAFGESSFVVVFHALPSETPTNQPKLRPLKATPLHVFFSLRINPL